MRRIVGQIVGLIALGVVLAGCTGAPDASIERRRERVERGLIRAYGDPPWTRMTLEERMAAHRVPGLSIAVINDDRIEWMAGYGVKEAGSMEPVTPDTLFQAASIAKLVVAVTALQQVEQGRIALDRDVNRDLASWRVPENGFTEREPVTLRRLLSHNAGVTVSGFRGYARGEAVPTLRQVLDGESPANSAPIRVDCVPGSLYRYSGGGYMIVQQLLEDVSGAAFPDLVRDAVLEPWGMSASTLASPLPERLRPDAASGHRADGTPIPGGWHTYVEMGAGATLWSTSGDLARFAIRLMQAYRGQPDSVLSHDMAVEMLTPQVEGRGLGPVLGDDGGDRFYFMHPGANDGYTSVLVAYPKRGQGVVILTNGDAGGALWQELLNSVSVEYGWVADHTGVIVVLLLAMAVLAAGLLVLWRRAPPSGS